MMAWLKIGGIAAAAIAVFIACSWAAKTIRLGVEAEYVIASAAQAAAIADADAAGYQEGLNDGVAQAKTVEKIKVVYKRVPTNVQKADSCAVDSRAIELRNEARRAAGAAVSPLPAPGPPDAVTPAAGGTPAEPDPR